MAAPSAVHEGICKAVSWTCGATFWFTKVLASVPSTRRVPVPAVRPSHAMGRADGVKAL